MRLRLQGSPSSRWNQFYIRNPLDAGPRSNVVVDALHQHRLLPRLVALQVSCLGRNPIRPEGLKRIGDGHESPSLDARKLERGSDVLGLRS